MLVAGGVLDQPAGEWFAQQRAGYVWDLLDRKSKVTNWLTDTTLSDSDMKTLEQLGIK